MWVSVASVWILLEAFGVMGFSSYPYLGSLLSFANERDLLAPPEKPFPKAVPNGDSKATTTPNQLLQHTPGATKLQQTAHISGVRIPQAADNRKPLAHDPVCQVTALAHLKVPAVGSSDQGKENQKHKTHNARSKAASRKEKNFEKIKNKRFSQKIQISNGVANSLKNTADKSYRGGENPGNKVTPAANQRHLPQVTIGQTGPKKDSLNKPAYDIANIPTIVLRSRDLPDKNLISGGSSGEINSKSNANGGLHDKGIAVNIKNTAQPGDKTSPKVTLSQKKQRQLEYGNTGKPSSYQVDGGLKKNANPAHKGSAHFKRQIHMFGGHKSYGTARTGGAQRAASSSKKTAQLGAKTSPKETLNKDMQKQIVHGNIGTASSKASGGLRNANPAHAVIGKTDRKVGPSKEKQHDAKGKDTSKEEKNLKSMGKPSYSQVDGGLKKNVKPAHMAGAHFTGMIRILDGPYGTPGAGGSQSVASSSKRTAHPDAKTTTKETWNKDMQKRFVHGNTRPASSKADGVLKKIMNPTHAVISKPNTKVGSSKENQHAAQGKDASKEGKNLEKIRKPSTSQVDGGLKNVNPAHAVSGQNELVERSGKSNTEFGPSKEKQHDARSKDPSLEGKNLKKIRKKHWSRISAGAGGLKENADKSHTGGNKLGPKTAPGADIRHLPHRPVAPGQSNLLMHGSVRTTNSKKVDRRSHRSAANGGHDTAGASGSQAVAISSKKTTRPADGKIIPKITSSRKKQRQLVYRKTRKSSSHPVNDGPKIWPASKTNLKSSSTSGHQQKKKSDTPGNWLANLFSWF